jgi:hypothetical protein
MFASWDQLLNVDYEQLEREGIYFTIPNFIFLELKFSIYVSTAVFTV